MKRRGWNEPFTSGCRLFRLSCGAKKPIKSSQIKAAVSVNRELIGLYWELAEKIVVKQKSSQWGDGLLAQMSKDLQDEFPDMKGFSFTAHDITNIDGIGSAKAASIAAAFEFVRRRIKPEGLKIKFPADVLPLIQHYTDRKQEHFLCISINGANES